MRAALSLTLPLMADRRGTSASLLIIQDTLLRPLRQQPCSAAAGRARPLRTTPRWPLPAGIVQCRSGSIIFASPPQQHRFNCPFQLADTDLVPEADTPACALTYDLLIEPGDFVVMATDGVFDNVFPEEIAQLCETYGTANRAVEAITVLAFQRSQDPQFLSPFALASRIDDQEEMLEFRKGDKSLRARLQEARGGRTHALFDSMRARSEGFGASV